jgi:hypothetical protein
VTGSRQARRPRKRGTSSRAAFWTLIWPVAAIFSPAIALLIFSPSAGPDLSDLVPAARRSDGYVMLAWQDLERTHRSMYAGPAVSGAMICALGYMMDGDGPVREGDRVPSFILLPDAGSLLHPAHRLGDEMIDVRLEARNEVRFAARSLVWVWGTLRALSGKPSERQALYVLQRARAAPADKADIPKFFR